MYTVVHICVFAFVFSFSSFYELLPNPRVVVWACLFYEAT